MPIDVETPQSPGWWLKRLQRKLDDRRKRIDPLFARFEGDAPLPVSMKDAPESAKAFFKTSRTNFYDMVVKTARYRLLVAFIQTSREQGEQGDAKAWQTWKRAGMLVEHPDIVRNMLVAGDGYGMVALDDDGPAATSEDPRQVVTIHDPIRQARIRAGGKFFADDDLGVAYAYLLTPGRVHVALKRAGAKAGRAPRGRFDSSWEWSEDHGGAAGQALPESFGNRPSIVRYRNDEGVGVFERHLDLFDRIDHLVLQGMAIATYQAFRQRAIKVSPEDMPDEDPETGEAIDYNDIFSADPGALWKLPATAEMWESGSVDTTPITTMVTKEMEKVSAVTFTPMSAFTPEGANQSAQGASLIREGSTFHIEDLQARIGAADAQLAAMLFTLADDVEVADPDQITIGWAPAERFGLSEKGSAAMAAKNSGMPWRTIMREIWQLGPEALARAEAERMSDAILFPEVTAGSTAADAGA